MRMQVKIPVLAMPRHPTELASWEQGYAERRSDIKRTLLETRCLRS